MAADLYARLKGAVMDKLLGLGLDGVGQNVVSQWQPDALNTEYPLCAVLHPPDDFEEIGDGTTEENDLTVPFLVLFLERGGKREAFKEPRVQGWREQALFAFTPDRIDAFAAAVPEAWNLELVPRQIVDPRARAFDLVASSFVLRVTVRKPKVY